MSDTNEAWQFRRAAHAATAIAEARAALAAAEARIKELEAAVIRTAASLAASISLLERGGNAAKKAAPSDAMFDQMLNDYRGALQIARQAMK